ncbi:type II/IV secretion system ATPase subunit [Candidatus Woesearchaeota archaeon]|nr:type II/IV secretion system ATPase subunit [Candidatus Woesearchaeota archaeon]
MPDKPACGTYEVAREGEEIIVRVNCETCPFFPSIEDNDRTMALVIDILAEVSNATKIVLVQKRDYEYDYTQTSMLIEIAKAYKKINRQKRSHLSIGDADCNRYLDPRFAELQDLLFHHLKADPILAYMTIIKISERENRLIQTKAISEKGVACLQKYYRFLEEIAGQLQETQLIQQVIKFLKDYRTGDRSLYRRVFAPSIKPDFMYTKLMASYPTDAEEIDSYTVNGTEITIFQLPNTIEPLYHVVPPEFKIDEDKYEILDLARTGLEKFEPKKGEFTDPERIRQVFYNISEDSLDHLASAKGITLRSKELQELTQILVRYTVGFGLIEVLLEDEKVQDVTINSPMGRTPIFIVHSEHDACSTNIIPTFKEAESWASKLRILSGRPLDEANPILDTELIFPHARARIAAISSPLNPTGLAFALRRHRDKPWTLSLFSQSKQIVAGQKHYGARFMNHLSAGLLSFLIDGNRTMLVAGTRSSGKTSLLGAIMVELMRKGRIISIEDTLELPVDALRKLNYNIQQLKVASALTRGTTEVSADEGIRSTLRLGDSSLIIGEVRSTESLALYEAMRVGALANLVAGTIHGDSPYGVFDRVVNDLKVPATSFKATDIIVIAKPIRTAGGLKREKRVLQITEVRKHWKEDPLREGGFVDLMKYNTKTDQLEPTEDLLSGDSEIIKSIAGNVKEWAGDWQAVWQNIELRAEIKRLLDEKAEKIPDILEADFVVLANDEFHRISEQAREEIGHSDPKYILREWTKWLDKMVKKIYG